MHPGLATGLPKCQLLRTNVTLGKSPGLSAPSQTLYQNPAFQVKTQRDPGHPLLLSWVSRLLTSHRALLGQGTAQLSFSVLLVLM